MHGNWGLEMLCLSIGWEYVFHSAVHLNSWKGSFSHMNYNTDFFSESSGMWGYVSLQKFF